MRNKAAVVIGLALVVTGILYLLSWLNVIMLDLKTYWPIALIILGIFVHMVFFLTGSRETSFLMTGATLLVCGIFMQVLILRGFELLRRYWPAFLLGPTLGYLEIYLLGGRDKDLLIPITFYALFALLYLGYRFGLPREILLTVGLIGAGLLVFTLSLMKKNMDL